MYIDILNIVEGNEYAIDKSMEGDNSLFGNRNIKFDSDIRLRGKYVFNQDTLTITATIIVSLIADCDKCLKQTQIEIIVPFNECFSQDNENITYNIVNNRAELDEAIKENILLNIPNRILCVEDCRGICPVCGCDLNITQCNCNRETEDKNPFAILKTIVGGAKNGSTKK